LTSGGAGAITDDEFPVPLRLPPQNPNLRELPMTVLPPMVELVLRTSVIALAALITGLLWDLIGAGLAFGASGAAAQGHRSTPHGRRRDQPAEPPGATGSGTLATSARGPETKS
jgi:hypothetical protein